MTQDRPETPLARRHLIRGGAVLAGAAVAGAMTTSPAPAADGEPVILGRESKSSSTTSITVGGSAGSTDPTLTLGNAIGPSLKLEPNSIEQNIPELAVGEIANTPQGPLIGLGISDGGVATGYLATNYDLEALPLSLPTDRYRAIDTRYGKDYRGAVRRTSPNPWDASGRLKAGAWIDLAVVYGGPEIVGVFFNITSPDSLARGFIQTRRPSYDLRTTVLSFEKAQHTTSFGYSYVEMYPDDPDSDNMIRIMTSATTHLIVDVVGFTSGSGLTEPWPKTRYPLPVERYPLPARRKLKPSRRMPSVRVRSNRRTK